MRNERYPSALDAAAVEHARVNLHETPEKRGEYITKLRRHFATQTEGTVNLTTEDDLLCAFLRGCKYDLQRAITKVQNYYRMRADLPSVFTNRDPCTDRMQEVLRLGCFVPLRKLQNGRMALIVRVGAFDPREYTIEEILKVSYMILDVCNRICPSVQVYGICAIFDLEGMSFAHATQATPSIIKHMVQSWENYHSRPKQLEIINAPWFINVLLNVVRSFMRKKMRERLRVHRGGCQSLHDIMDSAVLPIEYGGTDGSLDEHAAFWVQQITDSADWFKFDEQFKIL